ncbi:MAG: hypothetical protein JJE03_05255 [Peptostreptococcaceae bacterium]|nr:hypothetical protein [Peptostreptococcaceae bacterium]
MLIKLDGMDLESTKYYDCYEDGSLLATGVVSTKGMTNIEIELDNEDHIISLELAKASDKKENEAMSSILWSLITFFSSDIRHNYFTIYHCVHESIKIEGNNLSDRVINLKVEVPNQDKLYYSIEKDFMEESIDIVRESDINPDYMKRTYDRYKSLSLSIAIVLILIGAVLLFTSNREIDLYRTMAIGTYIAVCGAVGYIRRSKTAKKQYEKYH